MARKRMLDPSIWTDEGMAELEPRQQLLYIGLISNADDDGRLKGSTTAISLMLPTLYSSNDRRLIDDDLQSVLSCMTQLVRYEVDGRPYLAFKNYRQWQRIDRPRESRFPPPPDETHQNQPKQTSGDRDSTSDQRQFDDRSSNDRGSLALNRREVNRIEGNGIEGKSSADAPATPPTHAPKSSTRGTRLPRDFTVTDDMFAWATANGATPDLIASETEKFMDYWPAQPGARGVKLDWQATWRNWIRRATESPPPYAQRNGGSLTNHNRRGGYTAGELYEQSLREDVS